MEFNRSIAIDLFSGCGGSTFGLIKASLRVLAVVDNDPLSITTHHLNYKRTRIVENDVLTVDAKALMEELEF